MSDVELGPKAFCILTGIGVFSGLASGWIFRRSCDHRKLRAASNRILAHLFELRLFSDEPLLVIRAQRNLITANGAFLRQVIGPSLLLALPFSILLIGIDATFGRAPLRVGQPAVVTLQCRFSPEGALPQARLESPPGVAVEGPPVHVPRTGQISWRVRPVQESKGEMLIHCQGSVLRKSISSMPGIQWLSEERSGGLITFLRHPTETPFSNAVVNAIALRYPPATLFHLNWLIWFSLAFLSGNLALALARHWH